MCVWRALARQTHMSNNLGSPQVTHLYRGIAPPVGMTRAMFHVKHFVGKTLCKDRENLWVFGKEMFHVKHFCGNSYSTMLNTPSFTTFVIISISGARTRS